MNETKLLIEKITEGIQEKKGKNIVIADLTNIDDTICKYFVICQGNGVDGLRNAEWVAMDYSDVLVHVFLPEIRNFYNLENLWADAKLTTIPDID